MENREWDDSLKDMLGDYKPQGLQPDWNDFSNYMQVHEQMNQWEEEAFDENLKESVSDFEAPVEVAGWERIESSLNFADQQFDQNVRDRINQFDPKYNPHTWTLFLKRFTGLGYLRTKLIAFKVVEVAAVLLLLFTVVKMGQMGRLPFESTLFEKSNTTPEQDLPKVDMADQASKPSGNEIILQSSTALGDINSSQTSNAQTENINQLQGDQLALADNDNNVVESRNAYSSGSIPSSSILPLKSDIKSWVKEENPGDVINNYNTTGLSDQDLASATDKAVAHYASGVTEFMTTSLSPVQWNDGKTFPTLRYEKQRGRTYTEFGIVTQLDYNRMRMPEDRLYSAGQQIIFPQQGLPSSGFGGGFSFALGHPRWAIETGMIYNAKNFKPDRGVVVGNALDNGSVEFDAMKLQMVTVPLHFRYKIDHKGPFRVYGLTGLGFHMIAQSDVDVSIKYELNSLGVGEDPNRNPATAYIVRDTKRIREHIRDGAPFSTKTFLSLNTGAGVEYSITEHKTLFLQSAIQYQVPNLKFSNNNGKHLRSVSVQMGVRTPFGK